MFNVWYLRMWKKVAGLPKWRGKSVGIVRFWMKGEDGARSTAPTNSTDLLALFSFEGLMMNSNNIFLVTLEGMGQAAEGGLGNPCAEFWVHDYSVVTFTLTSKKDRSGNHCYNIAMYVWLCRRQFSI